MIDSNISYFNWIQNLYLVKYMKCHDIGIQFFNQPPGVPGVLGHTKFLEAIKEQFCIAIFGPFYFYFRSSFAPSCVTSS